MAGHFLPSESEAVLLKELERACPNLNEARTYALRAVCELIRVKGVLGRILPLAELAAGPGASPLIREARAIVFEDSGDTDGDGQ